MADNDSVKPVSEAQAKKAQAAAAADPLKGVPNFGVADAGGEVVHEQVVKSDPHAFEAIPAAKGPEAIGSGSPVKEDALKAMDDRRAAGVPEPPKVGPIPNVDLYDTPGGYQAVPAGFDPSDDALKPRDPRFVRGAGGVDNSEKVAGPGSKTVSE